MNEKYTSVDDTPDDSKIIPDISEHDIPEWMYKYFEKRVSDVRERLALLAFLNLEYVFKNIRGRIFDRRKYPFDSLQWKTWNEGSIQSDESIEEIFYMAGLIMQEEQEMENDPNLKVINATSFMTTDVSFNSYDDEYLGRAVIDTEVESINHDMMGQVTYVSRPDIVMKHFKERLFAQAFRDILIEIFPYVNIHNENRVKSLFNLKGNANISLQKIYEREFTSEQILKDFQKKLKRMIKINSINKEVPDNLLTLKQVQKGGGVKQPKEPETFRKILHHIMESEHAAKMTYMKLEKLHKNDSDDFVRNIPLEMRIREEVRTIVSDSEMETPMDLVDIINEHTAKFNERYKEIEKYGHIVFRTDFDTRLNKNSSPAYMLSDIDFLPAREDFIALYTKDRLLEFFQDEIFSRYPEEDIFPEEIYKLIGDGDLWKEYCAFRHSDEVCRWHVFREAIEPYIQEVLK